MTPCGWVPVRYPFGDGLAATLSGVVVELIPYVDEEGRAEVAGYAVRSGRGLRLVRVPGAIGRAVAVAEAASAALSPPSPSPGEGLG